MSYKVYKYGGIAVALLGLLFLRIGTESLTAFLLVAAFAFVGAGVNRYGAKLEEMERDTEFHKR